MLIDFSPVVGSIYCNARDIKNILVKQEIGQRMLVIQFVVGIRLITSGLEFTKKDPEQ